MEGKSLARSNDKIIAGVCGGLADYLGWTPTTVRLAYVFLSLISAAFPGILVYLVLWVVMPAPGSRRRSFDVHHPDDL
jgi:phage shock protein C